ncbi:MAG: hypothetical protein M0R74_09805 [Dehalococcoidia bacterium]|nr:hypothetical protein [Dehalococcoidia bacterium]
MLDKWELLRSYIRGAYYSTDSKDVGDVLNCVLNEMDNLKQKEEAERNRLLGKE